MRASCPGDHWDHSAGEDAGGIQRRNHRGQETPQGQHETGWLAWELDQGLLEGRTPRSHGGGEMARDGGGLEGLEKCRAHGAEAFLLSSQTVHVRGEEAGG